jgi:predicted DNA-binding transcriptional regulator AlpA
MIGTEIGVEIDRPPRQIKPATPSPLIEANLEHRAAAALAPGERPRKRAGGHVHGARAPPLAERLLSRHDVLAIVPVTYPCLWGLMIAGRFPRSRVVGGKSMWLLSEVNDWLAGLPVRKLKGDQTNQEK